MTIMTMVENNIKEINHTELEDSRPQETELVAGGETKIRGSPLPQKCNRSAELRHRRLERR